MSNYFVKMLLFTIAVLSAFVWLSYSIPQKVSLPPVREKFDASQVSSQADVVKIGQKIFYGKGQCALCHSIGVSHSARCPNLQGVGGKLTREFIHESLIHPQAYIYMDYEQSPPKEFPATMPRINKPPVDLGEPELLAVTAFAQSLGGEVTVTPEEFLATMPKTQVSGDAEAGRSVYESMKCEECHASDIADLISGLDELRMPDLIVEPTASRRGTAEAADIHKDFDKKLSVRNLRDLTVYLLTLKK